MSYKIELGMVVKDKITGFQGCVVCITRYLTGCDHAGLQPQGLHDGKPIDWQYFDVNNPELLKGGEV